VLIVVQLSIGILIMARLEYFPDLFRATTGGTTDGTIYVLLFTLQSMDCYIEIWVVMGWVCARGRGLKLRAETCS
jgi:hypothetical protein